MLGEQIEWMDSQKAGEKSRALRFHALKLGVHIGGAGTSSTSTHVNIDRIFVLIAEQILIEVVPVGQPRFGKGFFHENLTATDRQRPPLIGCHVCWRGNHVQPDPVWDRQ